MWLVSRTSVFTCFLYFLAEELGNRRNITKNKKNQSVNFEKGERFDND